MSTVTGTFMTSGFGASYCWDNVIAPVNFLAAIQTVLNYNSSTLFIEVHQHLLSLFVLDLVDSHMSMPNVCNPSYRWLTTLSLARASNSVVLRRQPYFVECTERTLLNTSISSLPLVISSLLVYEALPPPLPLPSLPLSSLPSLDYLSILTSRRDTGVKLLGTLPLELEKMSLPLLLEVQPPP